MHLLFLGNFESLPFVPGSIQNTKLQYQRMFFHNDLNLAKEKRNHIDVNDGSGHSTHLPFYEIRSQVSLLFIVRLNSGSCT
jgi:hypothetical protein